MIKGSKTSECESCARGDNSGPEGDVSGTILICIIVGVASIVIIVGTAAD